MSFESFAAPLSTVRITASRAKGQYGLNDRDLARLGCEYARNPHYRSAPCMRLYLLAEVEAASDAKREREAAWDAGREDRARAAKDAAREIARAARDRVSSMPAASAPSEIGSTPLPAHVWADAMRVLMREAWDPCIGARHVCSAAMACRDMRLASIEVLLTCTTGILERDVALERALSRAVSDPTALKKDELKQLCADMRLAVGGNKPELIVRVMREFGLVRPRIDTPTALMLDARRQRLTSYGRSLVAGDRALAFACRVDGLSIRRDDAELAVRRKLYERFGGDDETLRRISRSACVGKACDQPSSASCAAFMCQACCVGRADDDVERRKCLFHSVARKVLRSIHHTHHHHQRASSHTPPPPQRNDACAGCKVNSLSKFCNAQMCGLCCPRNSCMRHR
jgi:hypothetical protein